MTGTVIRGPWPGLTAADRRPGVPPTAGYLATRERLGFPSRPAAVRRRCPWCEADEFTACRVKATGRRLRQQHEARQAEA